jgi:hypothetical protein
VCFAVRVSSWGSVHIESSLVSYSFDDTLHCGRWFESYFASSGSFTGFKVSGETLACF